MDTVYEYDARFDPREDSDMSRLSLQYVRSMAIMATLAPALLGLADVLLGADYALSSYVQMSIWGALFALYTHTLYLLSGSDWFAKGTRRHALPRELVDRASRRVIAAFLVQAMLVALAIFIVIRPSSLAYLKENPALAELTVTSFRSLGWILNGVVLTSFLFGVKPLFEHRHMLRHTLEAEASRTPTTSAEDHELSGALCEHVVAPATGGLELQEHGALTEHAEHAVRFDFEAHEADASPQQATAPHTIKS